MSRDPVDCCSNVSIYKLGSAKLADDCLRSATFENVTSSLRQEYSNIQVSKKLADDCLRSATFENVTSSLRQEYSNIQVSKNLAF